MQQKSPGWESRAFSDQDRLGKPVDLNSTAWERQGIGVGSQLGKLRKYE